MAPLLVTVTAAISLLSGLMAPTALAALIVLVGCGPALPPNPPQDDPSLIPPPEGGGSGREPQRKNKNGGVSRPTKF